MFSTCSPVFCCLSARGLEVFLHFWQSWPTVPPLPPFIFWQISSPDFNRGADYAIRIITRTPQIFRPSAIPGERVGGWGFWGRTKFEFTFEHLVSNLTKKIRTWTSMVIKSKNPMVNLNTKRFLKTLCSLPSPDYSNYKKNLTLTFHNKLRSFGHILTSKPNILRNSNTK